MTSRRLLLALATSAVLAACASVNLAPSASNAPPIVFVHGNGDSAALWQTTFWRFESNGWPRDRLYAFDMPYPLSRDDDSNPQPGRSSTRENMAVLKSEVERVMRETGASKVMV